MVLRYFLSVPEDKVLKIFIKMGVSAKIRLDLILAEIKEIEDVYQKNA